MKSTFLVDIYWRIGLAHPKVNVELLLNDLTDFIKTNSKDFTDFDESVLSEIVSLKDMRAEMFEWQNCVSGASFFFRISENLSNILKECQKDKYRDAMWTLQVVEIDLAREVKDRVFAFEPRTL